MRPQLARQHWEAGKMPGAAMTSARILIVEDEALVALDLERRLTANGYKVVGSAAEGEAAVRLASKLRPDLVLMDVRLRGDMDGISAAAAIRSRHEIPVVYLTAYGDDATLARARMIGPLSYVLKPFEERELWAALERALSHSGPGSGRGKATSRPAS